MRRSWAANCGESAVLLLCITLAIRVGTATQSSVLPAVPALSLQSGERLAVIGVARGKTKLRRTDRKSLQNRRIGFGLTNLLAETLFETGEFRLLEEKDIRKREILEDLVYTYWIEPGAAYSEQVLRNVATQLGVKLLAYGSVSHTRSVKKGFRVGPLSRHTQKLLMRVNVCLYEVSTGTTLCHEGQGEAQQEGTGVIYEFRGDQLDFEKNATGRASKQAVTLAVRKLIARIRFQHANDQSSSFVNK